MLTRKRQALVASISVLAVGFAALYWKVNYTGPLYQVKQARERLKTDPLITKQPSTRNYQPINPIEIDINQQFLDFGPYRAELDRQYITNPPITGINDLLIDWQPLANEANWTLTKACRWTTKDPDKTGFQLEYRRQQGQTLESAVVFVNNAEPTTILVGVFHNSEDRAPTPPAPVPEKELQRIREGHEPDCYPTP
jgi:hypothetical protein